MTTTVKTGSDMRKAVTRKIGWPTAAKTLRTMHDAEDWARRTDQEMVRGIYLKAKKMGIIAYGAIAGALSLGHSVESAPRTYSTGCMLLRCVHCDTSDHPRMLASLYNAVTRATDRCLVLVQATAHLSRAPFERTLDRQMCTEGPSPVGGAASRLSGAGPS